MTLDCEYRAVLAMFVFYLLASGCFADEVVWGSGLSLEICRNGSQRSEEFAACGSGAVLVTGSGALRSIVRCRVMQSSILPRRCGC